MNLNLLERSYQISQVVQNPGSLREVRVEVVMACRSKVEDVSEAPCRRLKDVDRYRHRVHFLNGHASGRLTSRFFRMNFPEERDVGILRKVDMRVRGFLWSGLIAAAAVSVGIGIAVYFAYYPPFRRALNMPDAKVCA